MTVYYSGNATKYANQAVPQLIGSGEVTGVKEVAYAEFALSADLVGGTDTIRMVKLPKGARVHNVVLYFDDLDASGGTVDVGWEAGDNGDETADADGFMDAVDVTSAGVVDMIDDEGTRPGLFKQFADSVWVTIAPNGDTDATSGTIKLAVEFVRH